MNDLFKKIFTYEYHNINISNFKFDNNKIILNFEDGLYLLNEDGSVKLLTQPISMTISLDVYYGTIQNFVEIWNSTVDNITIKDFSKKFKKQIFIIDKLFFSLFDKTILIEGLFEKDKKIINGIPQKTLIIISDCTNVDFSYK